MKLDPHISLGFNGQCEAAFRVYERCLDGTIAFMVTWGDSPAAAEAPLGRNRGALIVPARISGREVRLAVDASADGPVRLRPAATSTLALSFSPDVHGREVSATDAARIRLPTRMKPPATALPGGR